MVGFSRVGFTACLLLRPCARHVIQCNASNMLASWLCLMLVQLPGRLTDRKCGRFAMVGCSRVGFDEAIFEPAEEPGRAIHMHLPNNVHSGCPMVLSVVSRMHLNRC